jgi:hypothetical protein
MASLRVWTGLTLALALILIVVLAVSALVGWAWMGGDHATWMGAIIEISASG